MRTVILECSQLWYDNGKLTCEEYRRDNVRHNEAGPSSRWWWVSGKLAREEYRRNGKLHNEAGPAMCLWNESGKLTGKYWCLDGKGLSSKAWEAEVARRANPPSGCAGRTVTIDGKEYRLEPVNPEGD